MFERVQANRLSDQIAGQIRKLIANDQIAPGEKLPTELRLAENFQVSRTSIREALFLLESEGLIERRKNGGTFVRDNSLARLLAAVEFPAKTDQNVFTDLLEARERLEVQAVELAIARADEMDLERIEGTLELLEQDQGDGKDAMQADILFHQCIAVATKNQIIAGIIRQMQQMLLDVRTQSLTVPGRLMECVGEHKEIFRAIKERNVALGTQIMQQHLSRTKVIVKDISTI